MNEFLPTSYPGMLLPTFARESGQWRSMGLAALMHGLLLAFLWVGVQWESKQTSAIEAEVWDMTARDAAPEAPMDVVLPAVPVPDASTSKSVPVDEPSEDPEIAIEQEKRRLLIEKKKQDALDLAQVKALIKKTKLEKLEEQKKKKEKMLADETEQKKLVAQKKLQSKEQSVLDKTFAENMRRLTGQVSSAGTGGTGDAPKSTGMNRGDPTYAARIAAKVRANTVFNDTGIANENPTVEYRIDLLPDGSLRGAVRKLKSSGVLAFDDAVEKAIEKSLPFPRDKTGEVPASITYIHRMKE